MPFPSFCRKGILGALRIPLKQPWNLILRLFLQICSIISLLVQTSLSTHLFLTLSLKSLGATSSFLLKQLTILVLRVRGSIWSQTKRRRWERDQNLRQTRRMSCALASWWYILHSEIPRLPSLHVKMLRKQNNGNLKWCLAARQLYLLSKILLWSWLKSERNSNK